MKIFLDIQDKYIKKAYVIKLLIDGKSILLRKNSVNGPKWK